VRDANIETDGCPSMIDKIESHLAPVRVFEIDLHGYHPSEIVWNGRLEKVVQQVWEIGKWTHLRLIHGHARGRGVPRGFYNSNTGFFGREIRDALRHPGTGLRQCIKHTTLDCSDWGATTVKLKPNPAPSRTKLDADLLEPRFAASRIGG
jgi:hypothetical protein